jgi:hypothetical protein
MQRSVDINNIKHIEKLKIYQKKHLTILFADDNSQTNVLSSGHGHGSRSI